MELDFNTITALDLERLLSGIPLSGAWRFKLDLAGRCLGVHSDGTTVSTSVPTGINDDWDFQLTLSAEEWERYCSEPRPRGYTTAQAVVATNGGRAVSGSRAAWARLAVVVDRVLDELRRLDVPQTQPARSSDPLPGRIGVEDVVGRYLNVEINGARQRLYFESAGTGPPLVCLHTAGADSRQYRYLLDAPEITSAWTVYAFDMPWHGRSEPPASWQEETYRLTTDTYAAIVMAFIEGLALRRPTLMGCSMGGAIALYLASVHGDEFTGVLALEGGLGNPSRFVDWTNRTDVDHSRFLISWVGGLIAPTSPVTPVAQTLWGYAQSGPGVYQGDTYFYSEDLPRHAADLAPATCPLYVFSGEYDYSATTEMSRAAVTRLGGELVVMDGKGHFPMSEDPEGFATYLRPVLDLLHDKYEF